MGDKRRFDLFASYIEVRVPKDARIADVAAGKGYLSFALLRKGFKHVTPFEPDPRRGGQVTRLGMHVENFTSEHARDFDVVVGMHPDAATDHILDGCARFGLHGIVVPCCIKPSAWTYWHNRSSHAQWESHLREQSRERGLRVFGDKLKMVGANSVIEVKP